MPLASDAPDWLRELALAYESGAHGQFVLYGNVSDRFVLVAPAGVVGACAGAVSRGMARAGMARPRATAARIRTRRIACGLRLRSGSRRTGRW